MLRTHTFGHRPRSPRSPLAPILVMPSDRALPLTADYDDDGETAAGSRLAHLLEILELENVLVVVSRWYGGTLLGADRFKHINQAARDALDKAGLLGGEKVASKGRRR